MLYQRTDLSAKRPVTEMAIFCLPKFTKVHSFQRLLSEIFRRQCRRVLTLQSSYVHPPQNSIPTPTLKP